MDVLPAAATKLQQLDPNSSSKNGNVSNGASEKPSTAVVPPPATATTGPAPAATLVEKDGDVVMDAVKPASPPVSSASSSTHSLGTSSQVPATSEQDTEMSEAL